MTLLTSLILGLGFGCASVSAEPPAAEPVSAPAIFKRLREAAQIPESDISLTFSQDDSVQAWYSYPDRTVRVTRGLLERYRSDGPVVAYVLAHEIGHAIQHRHGLRGKGEWTPKQLEADADALAQQLIERAGYASSEMDAAVRRFMGCYPKMEMGPNASGGGDHPSNFDRCVNMIAYKPAIDQRRIAARLDYVRPDIFDVDGRVSPSALIAPEGRAALAASLRSPDFFPSDPAKPAVGNPRLQLRAWKRVNKPAGPDDQALDGILYNVIRPPESLSQVSPERAEAVRRSLAERVRAASAGDSVWFKNEMRRNGFTGWLEEGP